MSLDIDPVLFVLDLHMKYTYIYCVVCYRVIVAPYVRSVGHVFAYLKDDSERPMDYETFLLPKDCPLHACQIALLTIATVKVWSIPFLYFTFKG